MRPRSLSPAFAILVTAAAAAACNPGGSRSPQYAQPGPSGQYAPPGQYAPRGPYAPPQGYPNQTPPGAYAPPGQPAALTPQVPSLPSAPGVPNPFDPINTVDMAYLHGESSSVMGELIDALGPSPQSMVKGIPLVTDSTPGVVNAFAGCDDQALPFMAITDGLLQIEAYIAQFKATDEVFGTQKLDGYLGQLAQTQNATPAVGFIDAAQNADPRKVARQHQLVDEQIAFVLGHELSHHYLGHTGCAKGQSAQSGVASAQDVGRAFTRALPMFNQINEAAADWSGTNSVLTTGARRQGFHWNEEGALLTLDFFAKLEGSSAAAIAASFIASHPHSALRRQGVLTAASSWRATGGVGIPVPTFPNIFNNLRVH